MLLFSLWLLQRYYLICFHKNKTQKSVKFYNWLIYIGLGRYFIYAVSITSLSIFQPPSNGTRLSHFYLGYLPSIILRYFLIFFIFFPDHFILGVFPSCPCALFSMLIYHDILDSSLPVCLPFSCDFLFPKAQEPYPCLPHSAPLRF